MKLIIWLGNPWDKYKNTRHNLGFLFLDYFKWKYYTEEFRIELKFKWELSLWNIWWEKILLLKPNTYMNLCWESIKEVINFYKIEKKDWIVIFDDMSMDFSKIRYRDKWSAWWHNWIKSIIKYFWEEFQRIKVWVWYDNRYEVSDWVLSKFSEEELIDLDNEVFLKISELLKERFLFIEKN